MKFFLYQWKDYHNWIPLPVGVMDGIMEGVVVKDAVRSIHDVSHETAATSRTSFKHFHSFSPYGSMSRIHRTIHNRPSNKLGCSSSGSSELEIDDLRQRDATIWCKALGEHAS